MNKDTKKHFYTAFIKGAATVIVFGGLTACTAPKTTVDLLPTPTPVESTGEYDFDFNPSTTPIPWSEVGKKDEDKTEPTTNPDKDGDGSWEAVTDVDIDLTPTPTEDSKPAEDDSKPAEDEITTPTPTPFKEQTTPDEKDVTPGPSNEVEDNPLPTGPLVLTPTIIPPQDFDKDSEGDTGATPEPTKEPEKEPEKEPTKAPTPVPTKAPAKEPTKAPAKEPTKAPTVTEKKNPTLEKDGYSYNDTTGLKVGEEVMTAMVNDKHKSKLISLTVVHHQPGDYVLSREDGLEFNATYYGASTEPLTYVMICYGRLPEDIIKSKYGDKEAVIYFDENGVAWSYKKGVLKYAANTQIYAGVCGEPFEPAVGSPDCGTGPTMPGLSFQ